MSPIQKHIHDHCRGGRYDRSKSVDDNISVFNFRCVVGMIETGEATWADLDVVGGAELMAAIGKHAKLPLDDRQL